MSRLRYPFTEISARCRLCGAVGLTASSEHALGGRLIEWRRAHAPVCPEWPRWAANKGLRLDDRGALLYPNEDGPYVPRVRPKADGDGDDDLDELEELLGEVTNGAGDADRVGAVGGADSHAATPATAAPIAEQAEPNLAAAPIVDQAETSLAEVPMAEQAGPSLAEAPMVEQAEPNLAAAPMVDQAEPRLAAAPMAEQAETSLAEVPMAEQAGPSLAEAPIAEHAEPSLAAPPARRPRKPRAGVLPPEPEPEPRIDLMRVPSENLLQAELF